MPWKPLYCHIYLLMISFIMQIKFKSILLIFSFPIFVDGTEINKISVGETVNIKLALGQHRIEIKLLGKTIGILNVLIDDSHLSQYYNFKTDINNRVKATTTNIVNNTQNINYSSINHQQPITSYPLKPKKKKGYRHFIWDKCS